MYIIYADDTAQYSQVQPSTAQYSPVQPSTAQYSPVQPSNAQYSSLQSNTEQNRTEHFSAAQLQSSCSLVKTTRAQYSRV